MNRDIIAFTKYKFNVYGNKDIRSGKDSAVVGIVGKSKSLDFPTMLIFWSLVRNSVVLAVYLLFSVACFLTVHEHYIRYYIDAHKKELGILKALGYSDWRIAGNFYVFSVSILIGTAAGFAMAFIIMPFFYRLQNEDKILPEFTIGFHPSIFIYFVVIPTALFALLSVVYAYIKLKMPVISLLKDNVYTQSNPKKTKTEKNTDRPFIDDLKRNTLKTKKTLVFFSIFSAFCFSAMMQMSYSMIDLSSEMMAAMIMIIGIILSCVTLFLAVTTVINGNTKTIAMMRVFGYSQKECCNALLGGYRPLAYIGFAAGTVYQYALLRVMVDVVFKNIENVPLYEFNFKAMLVTLICFAVIYELVMYFYSERIKKISVKEIMLE